MEFSSASVVFDVGSSLTRVGFSNNAIPATIFPTVTASVNNHLLVGSDAAVCADIKKHVIDNGVSRWNWMEKIWCHGYQQLKTEPESHPVLVNYPYFPCCLRDREKIAEIMFESLNIPSMHLTHESILSLYSHGRLTGLVVHSGFNETQTYPVYEGHILSAITRELPVAGRYLTEVVQDLLQKKGYNCSYKSANEIKEKSFYVAKDCDNEICTEDTFTLPDGKSVTLGKEKFLIPEELFTSFNEFGVIQDLVVGTTCRCDLSLRKDLFMNIVLSGGNTLLPGFAQRLENEVRKMCLNVKLKNYVNTKVIAPENRDISAWVGGAVLASLPTFPDMCMTREEYNDYGPGFVHRKFF